MLTELPQGWTRPRFGQLYKRVKRVQGDEDLPVLSVTVDGIVLQADHFNKKVASADTSNYLRVRRGEVAMSGLNLWKGGIDTQRIVPEGVVSPAYKVYALRPEAADADFMAHYLRSPSLFRVYKDVSQQGASIVRRNVDFGALHASKIPLPPPPEQRKIAAVLASVDEAIQATEAVIEQTRRVKEGLLQDLLTRGIGHSRFKQTEIGEIPESWEVSDLKRVIGHFDSGWSPVCDSTPAQEHEWAVLKTSSVVWDGYSPEANKRLPDDLQPQVSAEVIPNDILITRKGPADRVGVVAYVDATPPRRMIPDTVIRIRVADDGPLEPGYVALALGSSRVQYDWKGKKVGLASAQVNINRTILNRTRIPVPPISEQQQILGVWRQYRDTLASQGEQMAELERVKAGLLQELLTGAVRVSP